MAQHPLYQTWFGIIKRCKNPNSESYARYGGRGILVCDRWLSFEAFREDMGEKPSPKHSVDRIDNDGNYEPDNCRWATNLEQHENKGNSRTFVRDGITYRAAALAHQYGIQTQLVLQRERKGKTLAEIVSRHHLEPGYDKVKEMIALAKRQNNERTHCMHGHEMTPENTKVTPEGYRACRACAKVGSARRRAKMKSA